MSPLVGGAGTTMGVSGDNSAWVAHRAEDGTRTSYRVAPREAGKMEYLPADYDVALEEGPDVLDHDFVRGCAHDAFIDAYGAL